MKNITPILLIVFFANVFAVHAQNQDSTNSDGLKKSIAQELYIFLNEKSENPLLLINGFIWGNDTTVLSIINPTDIKDISVLKDKDYNIYGEKGKNGVLFLTLKDQNINTLEKFKTFYGLNNDNSKQQRISGVVYDVDKKIIPNVFISNLNRKESFKADSNGNYSLSACENDILVFYLDGFKSKIFKVKDTNMEIVLESKPKSEIYIK
ncbi:hypothetical protein ABS764_01730 [Flavobacterium sp. ST-87]|uniref:CarboxypepD_reg-like domain-containing protein n=1 Tax=Flavobacterium plantiphilum TaxID=3163297 RepID=A0ABW8XQY4_9FLAO